MASSVVSRASRSDSVTFTFDELARNSIARMVLSGRSKGGRPRDLRIAAEMLFHMTVKLVESVNSVGNVRRTEP